MPSSPHTLIEIADPGEISALLGIPNDQLSAPHRPRAFALVDESRSEGGSTRPAAILLESGRAGTLSRKFSHVRGETEELVTQLIELRFAACAAQGQVSVKWEDPALAFDSPARSLGFTRLPAPCLSGPGTEAPAQAWVRYIEPWDHVSPPYYRQTTDFSCGPVSLLMAEGTWKGEMSLTREREREVWRRATRFTGCGVQALALQVDQAQFKLRAFDTEFLEPQLQPMEPRRARAFANEEDRRLVAETGIDMNERVFSIAEIAAAIENGEVVALLIDQLRFHDEAEPHWVVVHTHRDGVFLLHDPWVEETQGESWVDAMDVAVTARELDEMAWWGAPKYRSAFALRARARG